MWDSEENQDVPEWSTDLAFDLSDKAPRSPKRKKKSHVTCAIPKKIFYKIFAQIRFTFLRMWKISLLTRLRLMMSGTVSVTSITNCSSFPYCVTLRRWITCHRNADISRSGGTTRRRAERGRAWGEKKRKIKVVQINVNISRKYIDLHISEKKLWWISL